VVGGESVTVMGNGFHSLLACAFNGSRTPTSLLSPAAMVSPNPSHPTPCTLRTKPYTLHPKPYTVHSKPYTLHPNP